VEFFCIHFIIDIKGSLLNTAEADAKSWVRAAMGDAENNANEHYGEACLVSLP